jgi:hypothetical protein
MQRLDVDVIATGGETRLKPYSAQAFGCRCSGVGGGVSWAGAWWAGWSDILGWYCLCSVLLLLSIFTRTVSGPLCELTIELTIEGGG